MTNAQKQKLSKALAAADADPNRRNGVQVKKHWHHQLGYSRTIFVTINRITTAGAICQVMVSGSSKDTSEYMKTGGMGQKEFDSATFFLTRMIQHGEDPKEMLDALVPIKQDKNHVIKEPTTLIVAVLEVVVEEMDRD